VGVVIGTIYMTYQAAANPDEFYRDTRLDFEPDLRLTEFDVDMVSDLYFQRPQPQLGYGWTF
jgi:hypothetical protein